MAAKRTLAEAMREKLKEVVTEEHLVVKARAGTGKTTTLIEGLKLLHGIKPLITPSAQQQAVWNELMKSAGKSRSCCFVAFNKSIADELKTRVPRGVDAMTMHSMGLRTVTKCLGRLRVDQYRTQNLISTIMGDDIRNIRKKSTVIVSATEALVGLCKVNLIGPKLGVEDVTEIFSWDKALDEMARYYDIELEADNGTSHRTEIFDLVPRVIALAGSPTTDGCIDFNDMIWLPVVLGLSPSRYGILLVDEAQDLNKCQQELALMTGDRIILVGDDRQAIYGFAGADCDSLPNLTERLKGTVRGCVEVPLTVTRRCGKKIVNEARLSVPDFEAFETNSDGSVVTQKYGRDGEPAKGTYHENVKEGDMVLCRVNAPLVGQCFRFLKAGLRANIQGRNIGQGLISLIHKMKVDRVTALVAKISDWVHDEQAKEMGKRNPSEAKIIAISDKGDCIIAFCDGCEFVSEVEERINKLFTDDPDRPGIRLSSIHKAKGLESKRVFFLMPKGGECPHPMSRTPWQRKQEQNLLYVGITRAIEELIYVIS